LDAKTAPQGVIIASDFTAMGHSEYDPGARDRQPWNAGRKLGGKRALKPQQVWAIRFWLDRECRLRDRAMFDLAIDSKLRGCDVVKIKIGELVSGGQVRSRAIVIQQKTRRAVQFELLEPARGSILAWLERRGGTLDDFVFPSRIDHADHISTRQYARLVDEWVTGIGLRREDYGTHSLRRTKASIIYKQTGNLRAVQILLGHTKIDYVPCRIMSRSAVRPVRGRLARARSPDIVRVVTGF
jgi:integrase